MQNLDAHLADIESLVKGKPSEAQLKLQEVIEGISASELRTWEADLRKIADHFYPKKRKSLNAILDAKLGRSLPVRPVATPDNSANDEAVAVQNLHDTLRDLSGYYIYHWAEQYRDFLSEEFGELLKVLVRSTDPNNVLASVQREISEHSYEIFSKGVDYERKLRSTDGSRALGKSLSGLERFLQLPIEFYLARVWTVIEQAEAVLLRGLCSSIVCGIIEGYGAVAFDEGRGRTLLPDYPRYWAHYVGFLVAPQLRQLLEEFEPTALVDGLLTGVVPVLEALDSLLDTGPGYLPLPISGQFFEEQKRLELALRQPEAEHETSHIQLFCIFDAECASFPAIQAAFRRDVTLVVAPLKADVALLINASPEIARQVVSLTRPADRGTAAERVRAAIQAELYARQSPRATTPALTLNYARGFPVQNAFLSKFYFVHRGSVRELLRTFEKRNGVRLWCSVRRSGKTTACFDLAADASYATIVSQTCDSTEQRPGANRLYDLVNAALEGPGVISGSFLAEAVESCAPQRSEGSSRYVLIVDEYETLFGRLRSALRREPEVRYTVVQPLLNQMVAFSRDNLLVFLGQQPGAHFILMDQNQLPAYVEQDPFPLFAHARGERSGEFVDLLNRILSDRLPFEPSFADAVFRETAGHPFLTAKCLVEFVDWLIESRRPVRSRLLSASDFEEFEHVGLTDRKVSESNEYVFFREAAAEAMSSDGRTANPWLFAIYSVVQAIGRRYGGSCSRDQLDHIVREIGAEELGLSSSDILRTATQSNFLVVHADVVKPRIRLLGRITTNAVPRVTA